MIAELLDERFALPTLGALGILCASLAWAAISRLRAREAASVGQAAADRGNLEMKYAAYLRGRLLCEVHGVARRTRGASRMRSSAAAASSPGRSS